MGYVRMNPQGFINRMEEMCCMKATQKAPTEPGAEKDVLPVQTKAGDTEASRGRSRRKMFASRSGSGLKRVGIIAGITLLCLASGAGGFYAYKAQQYEGVFFPNTTINGLDASGKTIDEIKSMIEAGMANYTLTMKTREGLEEQVRGVDIGLHSEYDGTLETILSSQNPYKWGYHYLKGTQHTISTMMAYDSEQLESMLLDLESMDRTKASQPKNAYLSEYIEGSGYQIVPEEQGNRLIYETVVTGVSDAIRNLQQELVLEEIDAYEKPEKTSTDQELAAQAEAWNRYTDVTVTYKFGDKTEILDGTTIHTWMTPDEDGNAVLSEELVAAYVKNLGDQYNTAYKTKTLKTSYGPVVAIHKGNYGWRINQGAETAALIEIIRSGTGQNREPVYSQTAASRGEHDYGNTYVEINLTAQHLYFYKDGKLLVEADFVSGNEAKGWSTPAGAYPLTYKQRNATLKGEGYATPVSYWMPFNGGIGLHDAGWRSSFGGSIYKSGGSHGCINLPPSAAQTIYENISAGMPVLCYHLDGTEKGNTTVTTPESKAPETMTAAPAETTAASTETTAPVVPAESTASPAPPETTAAPQPTPAPPTETSPAPPPSTAPSEAVGPGMTSTEQKSGPVIGPGM